MALYKCNVCTWNSDKPQFNKYHYNRELQVCSGEITEVREF